MEQERKNNTLSDEELRERFSKEIAFVTNQGQVTQFPDSLEPREFDTTDMERWRGF